MQAHSKDLLNWSGKKDLSGACLELSTSWDVHLLILSNFCEARCRVVRPQFHSMVRCLQ